MAQGFPRENLLTEHSRKIWLLWKETHSDWWGPGLADPDWKKRVPAAPHAEDFRNESTDDRPHESKLPPIWELRPSISMVAIRKVLFPPTGTIHCSALNEKGEISGTTTTSGLAWKLPGRCGDSPIIGAGCYTDQDVGSAGATGSGEENIKVAGAHTIVENMRHGMSPLDAGMDALKRIVRNYNGDMDRLRFIDMTYYVLRKDGAYAGVSLWEGYEPGKPHKIAVHDGVKAGGENGEPVLGRFAGMAADAGVMRRLNVTARLGNQSDPSLACCSEQAAIQCGKRKPFTACHIQVNRFIC